MNQKPVNILSYSSISTYLICGAYWKFKYIHKIKTPLPAPAFFGIVFHQAIGDYLTQGTQKKTLAEWVGETWDYKKYEWENCPGGIAWDKPAADQRKEIINLATFEPLITELDSLNVAYDQDGPAIERKFQFTLPGVDVPIVGYIDLIDQSGNLIDIKTTSTPWTDQKAKSELQPLFYSYGLRELGKKEVGNFTHLVIVRGDHPIIQKFVNSYSDFRYLEFVIRQVWENIKNGIYPRQMDENHWKCNPKYCEFWSMCKGAVIK